MRSLLSPITCVIAVCFTWHAQAQNLSLEPIVTSGLNSPLYVTAAPGDNNRLFIVQKGGAIRLFDRTTGTLQTTPYLNLSTSINTSGERGLLGLAFDPDFATNGRFYVNYTNTDGDIVLARHVANGTPLTSTSASTTGTQMIDLVAHSSRTNHNGGWIGFKPSQPGNNTPAAERHHLYMAVGDGGGGGDPDDNGQNPDTLLGSMLRLDVSGNGTATIPDTNPFEPDDGALEVWDYGLRNPWRNSFDRATGDFLIADVGQDSFEEVNLHANGAAGGINFGWDLAEGNSANPNFTNPIYTYPHVSGNGSITGGYVYRGNAIPGLQGQYIFGDFVSGQIFTMDYNGASLSNLNERTDELTPLGGGDFELALVSFGEDAAGELYLVDFGGAIYQIVPEPNSLIILCASGCGVLLWLRRQRTSQANS